MRRTGEPMTLSLPPFTKAVTWLVGNQHGFYLLRLVLGTGASAVRRFRPRISGSDAFAGCPSRMALATVTYSFIHFEFWHWFGNMLGLWMFGAPSESAWGTRRFVELYSIGVIGAAITTVALSYSHLLGNPDRPTIGASGGVFAILIAFGMLFGETKS